VYPAGRRAGHSLRFKNGVRTAATSPACSSSIPVDPEQPHVLLDRARLARFKAHVNARGPFEG